MLVLLVVACGGGAAGEKRPTSAPAEAPAPSALLKLDVDPPDAEVKIDGELLGQADSLPTPLPLEPGLHRIEIRRDGYEIWRAEVAVHDDSEHLEVKLEATPR